MVIVGVLLFLAVLLAIPGGAIAAVYFAFQRKFAKAVAFLLFAAGAWLIVPESKFYPYMLIDTAHAKQFSVARFEQISVGMTRGEVEQRIGKRVSDYTSTSGEAGAVVCERQTDDGALKYWDFAWYNASICYDANDRVVDVSGYWQED